MKRTVTPFLTACLLTLVGCATSNNVVVNPGSRATVSSAYVVAHGDNSADMDASIQRALMARGVRVTAGPERQTADADVLVRYTDSWKWDMAMYLRSLDVQVYDAKNGSLLGSGAWKNSAMHGFHDRDKVVKNVLDELLTKLRAPIP